MLIQINEFLPREPVRWRQGVLQGYMQIKTGSGSIDQVTGNVLDIGIGMLLPSHVKEGRIPNMLFLLFNVA